MGQLKCEIRDRLNINPKELALFTDRALKKRIDGTDMQLLTALGLKHGNNLYIGNKDVVMQSV